MTKQLEGVRIPDEDGAQQRAWNLVCAAYAGREPRSRRTKRLVPALVSAALLAAAAAVLSPPGRAVLQSVREAVGLERAEPALYSLPAGGRLLISSGSGSWVVSADGSRRRLGSYRSASWSPHGLYVAATRRNALYALTPEGEARWALARPDVRYPRWAGTRTDTRIAYVDRSGLRVVSGNGTGDRLIAPAEAGPATWRPGPHRELAYVSASEVRVQDADSGRVVWRATRGPAEEVIALSWSTDGKRLLVVAPHALRVYDARGRLATRADPANGARYAAASFVTGSHDVAAIRVRGAQSDVFLLRTGRLLFRGTGVFDGLVPSPDGRWLLVAWPTADQWVFVRVAGGQRLRAVASISSQFRSGSFPRVEGWTP